MVDNYEETLKKREKVYNLIINLLIELKINSLDWGVINKRITNSYEIKNRFTTLKKDEEYY